MTATLRSVRLPRGAVIAIVVVVAALVAALAGGRPHREGPPLDPRSDGELGTSALVQLLRALDADVSLSVGLPDGSDDVALLLQDRLDLEQIDALTSWVLGGGTLVVTDPASSFVPLPFAGGEPFEDLDGDSDELIEPGTCTIAALRGIGSVAGGNPVRYEPVGIEDRCFASEDGAYVTRVTDGAGEVVAVGGAAFLTNALLDDADNAVLAAALLAPRPGTAVRIVDAPIPAGGGTKGLGDLIPGGVRRGLWQLAIAFGLYAIWRAIRLGRPVEEDLPVPIAGSELVSAVGRLLGRTRSAGPAAEQLRTELRRRLRARFGVDPHADASTLASIVAARTGRDEAEVLAAVDHRPVDSDAELVAVARAVSSINQEVPR